MILFKDFIHKMAHSFLALFLLSFAIGAMESNLSEDDIFNSETAPTSIKSPIYSQDGGKSLTKGFGIKKREVSFNGVKFCATHTTIGQQVGYEVLSGIKGKSVAIMSKKNLLGDIDIDKSNILRDWSEFNNFLDNNDKKSIAGEAAAVVFLKNLNYIPLPAQASHTYKQKYAEFNSCVTQNGSNHGIDGIFIHKNEKNMKPSHIIINEAKFSSNGTPHFGTKDIKGRTVSQSHSEWNKANFSLASCIGDSLGQYDQQTIIRTATLLDSNGEIKLFEIKDQEDGQYLDGINDFVRKTYASEASPHLHLHHVYTQFQQNLSTKGYTLH